MWKKERLGERHAKQRAELSKEGIEVWWMGTRKNISLKEELGVDLGQQSMRLKVCKSKQRGPDFTLLVMSWLVEVPYWKMPGRLRTE